MSVTISIRVEEDTLHQIEEMGYKPGEFLKSILQRELRKERARRTLEWLKKHRIKHSGRSAQDIIREDRDSR